MPTRTASWCGPSSKRSTTIPPHLVVAAKFGAPEPEKKEEPAPKDEAPRRARLPPSRRRRKRKTLQPTRPSPLLRNKTEDEPAEKGGASNSRPARRPAAQARQHRPRPGRSRSQSVHRAAGPADVSLAGTAVTFYVNDTVAGGDFAAQAKQALMALEPTRTATSKQKEVPENAAPQLGQFDGVDADEDGKVYPDEIVAFLKQQQAGLRAQIHAKASDREDALFAALDQNHDERLDAREVEQTPERLAALDTSGDGVLRRRRNSRDADRSAWPAATWRTMRRPVRSAAAGGPRTGRGHAPLVHLDGRQRRRRHQPRGSFSGPPEKFQSLDTSGDGLVDAAEAKAAQPQPAP